jgi:RNA polymerase sigma-70 factor (ECF subfamily)
LKDDHVYIEIEVLNRIAGNDQKAFALLIEQYSAIVYSHVLSYIKNAYRAEELTQDIFMNIWNRREELPNIRNFRGYLYTLTRNRTISALRERIMRYDDASKDELETSINPVAQVEYRQLSDALRRGIDRMPARRREVFLMSRFDDKTYDEIANHFNISKSAVNKHIVEALVFLRTFLREEMGVPVLIFLLSYLIS